MYKNYLFSKAQMIFILLNKFNFRFIVLAIKTNLMLLELFNFCFINLLA